MHTISYEDGDCSLQELSDLRCIYKFNWLKDNLNDLYYIAYKIGKSILLLADKDLYHDDINP